MLSIDESSLSFSKWVSAKGKYSTTNGKINRGTGGLPENFRDIGGVSFGRTATPLRGRKKVVYYYGIS